jgi:hypothetical protein
MMEAGGPAAKTRRPASSTNSAAAEVAALSCMATSSSAAALPRPVLPMDSSVAGGTAYVLREVMSSGRNAGLRNICMSVQVYAYAAG